MSAHRHQAAQALFEAALALPEAERDAFLERACGADRDLAELVRALVRLDGDDVARVDTPAIGLPAPPNAGAAGDRPRAIGPYRVVGRLGAGGMGVVYEAEQAGVERRVAVKVLRAELSSPEMLRRFEVEMRALGRLSHPGIARILDAGTADLGAGRQPYFAMELVRGEPLLDHARRRGLTLRRRLALFADVCDAVQHAHQKGVIHRDLKPSNILVDDEGRPRILDFGIARVVEEDRSAATSLTRTGELLGTLAYMSPEQLGGDAAALDTRCDVYALGVIAYELLAGVRPFELEHLAIAEAVRVVQTAEPPRLGRHGRALAGDLETIVGKALEKAPERRYRSVDELAGDVRRHLSDEPITSRPPSVAYKLSKYARRNRALVLGLAGVVVALAAGMVSTTRMYLRAETARAAEKERRTEAEEAADTLRATNEYFLGLLASATPWGLGSEARMSDALASAARGASTAFVDRPKQRAELLGTLGITHMHLGLWREATGFFSERVEILRSRADGAPDVLAGALVRLAAAQCEDHRFEVALASLDEAGGLLDGLGDSASPRAQESSDLVRARVVLGLGRFEDAANLAGAELERLERGPSRAEDRAITREVLARARMELGEYAEAERLLRTTIDELDAECLAEGADAQVSLNTLVALLNKQKRFAEAATVMERVLTAMRRIAGDDHPMVATQMQNLATVLRGVQQLDRSEQLYREALALSRAQRRPPHFDIAGKLSNLGSLLSDRGRLDEALRLLTEADPMLVAIFGDRSPERVATLTYLAITERRAGLQERAREHFDLAHSLAREFLSPLNGERGYLMLELGGFEMELGRPAAAVDAFDEVYRSRVQTAGERSLTAAFAARELALALCETGRAGEGVELSRSTLAIVESDHGHVARAVSRHHADHGWCLWLAGRRDEAEPLLRTSLDELRAAYGEDHEVTRRQRARLEARP